MPISKSSAIFQLIKSLSTAEKRNFKLYASRNHKQGQLKFIELFEIIDKGEVYDEEQIMTQLGGVSKSKIANLKRHLYTQILDSLRVITVAKRPNIEVRGMIDYAYILYDKGFYIEAIKILEKAKKHAETYHLYNLHLSIIEFEKKIESRHITRSGKDKGYALITESEKINKKVSDAVHLSNLRIDLHAKYLQNGHCRSEIEKSNLEQFFSDAVKDIDENELGAIEKIYLYQSYVWYNHILLNFDSCLVYAIRWLELLESEPQLITQDVDLYLRAYHYILSSCFHLRKKEDLENYLQKIESFRKANYKRFNTLSQIISFQYVHSARLNKIIINGDFTDSQKVISRTLKRIKRYQTNLDAHRIMVFYFKIAWIYFCDRKYSKSILYLNKIVNNELPKLREDLQIYSRVMFLMCHYELDNFDVFRYSIRSFKPYFKKLENVYPLQVITQKTFLKLADTPRSDHSKIMETALKQLKELQKNGFYKVSFTYLDIISWLESKLSK